jgi:hypothetical protein
MGLRLHAIALVDGHPTGEYAPATQLVQFRELGAVVAEAPYALDLPNDDAVVRHHEIVGSAFGRLGAVLPAPVGTVFRSKQSLEQWLELHYVALTDALAFVEDRVEARVHVTQQKAKGGDRDVDSDEAGVAAESFRALRRRAVAALPLRLDDVTGLALSSAFLVDRELWKEFVAGVDEERASHPTLVYELSGPWPPYDFVRMQFGG